MNYLADSKNRSIIDSVLSGYKSREGSNMDTQLYEAQVKLAYFQECSYLFDKKIEKLTGKDIEELTGNKGERELPDTVMPLKTLFSSYRDKNQKNFLHLLMDSNISKESLRIWLSFLPQDMLFAKDYNEFSPLVYSISQNQPVLSILKEMGIKLPYSQIQENFSHIPFSTKKGLEHIRFAVSCGDINIVKSFYDKHPKALQVSYKRDSHITPYCQAIASLQIPVIDYFSSKGCYINQNPDPEIMDDIISILFYAKKKINNDKTRDNNLFYLYMKNFIIDKNSDYIFKNNFESLVPITTFDKSQADLAFEFIPDLRTTQTIHQLMDICSFLNRTEFMPYLLDNYSEILDVNRALNQMMSFQSCKTDFIKQYIEYHEQSEVFKKILETPDENGNTLLHSFAKKIIQESDIAWFKYNDFNLFVYNHEGIAPFDYLSDKAKEVAQKLYIEEYINREKRELTDLIQVNAPNQSVKIRI